MEQISEKPQEIQKIEEACQGLFPGSDVRHYFNAFLYDPALYGNPGIENVLTWAGYTATNTAVEMMSLRHFLAPVTAMLPEYGLAEKALARKYLMLQNALEEVLDSIKVIRIGDKKSESIIIGDTNHGVCAGVRINKEVSLFG